MNFAAKNEAGYVGWFRSNGNDHGFEVFTIDSNCHTLDAEYGKREGMTHVIRVSDYREGSAPAGMSSFRFCQPLKTRVKVLVDEGCVETWPGRWA